MAKPVRLSNGRKWATQGQALQHFKEILGRHVTGSTVNDPIDHSDLHALLEAYDSVLPSGGETKIGCGVANFSKQRNSSDHFSTDGFHIHRTDGSTIDFSYIRAVQAASKLGDSMK